MLKIQPFEVNNFTGGITNQHTVPDTRSAEVLENLFINDAGKLESRPGTEVFYADTDYEFSTSTDAEAAFVFLDKLWIKRVVMTYADESTAWAIPDGFDKDGAVANLRGITARQIDYSGTQDKMIITSASLTRPFVISEEVNDAGTDEVRIMTLGMPTFEKKVVSSVEYPHCESSVSDTKEYIYKAYFFRRYQIGDTIYEDHGTPATFTTLTGHAGPTVLKTSAIAVQTAFLAHINDAGGEAGDAHDSAQSTSWSGTTPTDDDTAIALINDMVDTFILHEADANNSSPTWHQGQSTRRYLMSDIEALTVDSAHARVVTLGNKVYDHSRDRGASGGEPHGLSSVPRQTTFGSSPADGTLITVQPAASTLLDNGTGTGTDTTTYREEMDIKIRVYRTKHQKEVFYFVREFYANEYTTGTTLGLFHDAVHDDFIEDYASFSGNTGNLLYTENGVLANDPPPKARYVEVANNIAWYGYVKEEGTDEAGNTIETTSTHRVRQSKIGNPAHCPIDFYIDLEDEITGISSVEQYPIVFCTNHIYRLAGHFNQFGDGGISSKKISSTIGCKDHYSIVKVHNTIYFAGCDGFYATDGNTFKKLAGDKLDDTYQTLLSTGNLAAASNDDMSGAYHKETHSIYWTAKLYGGTDNDAIIVYSIKYDAFTIWRYLNAQQDPKIVATFDGNIIMGGDNGYLYKHDSTVLTDPLYNGVVNPASWLLTHIAYNYKSTLFNFEHDFVRKWVPKISLFAEGNAGKLTLQTTSYNDDSDTGLTLAAVHRRRSITDSTKMITASRRFPASQLRCSYKQIQITNGSDIILNSQDSGEAAARIYPNIGGANKFSVDLTSGTWTTPEDGQLLNKYLSFYWSDSSNVEYSLAWSWQIESSTDSDTIVMTDTAGTGVTIDDAITYFGYTLTGTSPNDYIDNIHWMMFGYPLDEKLILNGYVVQYALISDTHTPFQLSEANYSTGLDRQ